MLKFWGLWWKMWGKKIQQHKQFCKALGLQNCLWVCRWTNRKKNLLWMQGSGAVKLTLHFPHAKRHKLSCFLQSQCVSEQQRKYIIVSASSALRGHGGERDCKKHKRWAGLIYSQRAWALAPVVLGLPAQRIHSSPTLQPEKRIERKSYFFSTKSVESSELNQFIIESKKSPS